MSADILDFAARPDDAAKLIKVGVSVPDPKLSAVELAAAFEAEAALEAFHGERPFDVDAESAEALAVR